MLRHLSALRFLLHQHSTLPRYYLRAASSRQFSTTTASSFSSDASYERKTPVDHVLLRPGMYIGQTEISTIDTWVYNMLLQRMEKKMVSYSPALLKIFDEILVNAADNFSRDKTMTRIDVYASVCANTNCLEISVLNDGKGIPIGVHAKENIHVPELIFGHLLTGSNFNDADSRLTGGSHGYGAKLTNIFSTMFEVEIYDRKKKTRYTQTWKDNMSQSSVPVIETKVQIPILALASGPASTSFSTATENLSGSSGHTKITFRPDLSKFNMGASSSNSNSTTVLLNDITAMILRRTVDVAGCIGNSVQVSFNSLPVPVNSFEAYVDLFADYGSHEESATSSSSRLSDINNATLDGPSISETEALVYTSNVSKSAAILRIFHSGLFSNKRWEVAVKLSSSGGFSNMSFVNSVWTPRGGNHVNVVTQQLIKAIEETLQKKGLQPNVSMIKNRMHVFVNCKIENPSFEGQIKDLLISKVSAFGSECVLPKSFVKMVIKESGIVESITKDLSLSALHESNRLLEIISKTSNKKIMSDIPKLEDAHWAGSARHALECTLILTEGDSAKALAVAGLEVVGRERFGILPLKGKVLNVRNATKSQLTGNVELSNVCKSLGLDFSKSYSAKDGGLHNQGLRYGKVLIMCDQDFDGSHIKGLIINLFHHYWPSLLTTEGFLQQFVTPVLKIQVPRTAASLSSLDGDVGDVKKLTLVSKQKKGVRAAAAVAEIGETKVDILSFYSMQQYAEWLFDMRTCSSRGKQKMKVKYYKGLGTSTSAEGRAYFQDLDKHRKLFLCSDGSSSITGSSDSKGMNHATGNTNETSAAASSLAKLDDIDMIFNKTRATERRSWLTSNYDSASYVDLTRPYVTYDAFLNKELIHYSFADNIRSIPSAIDGLKPSQRKVLFGCLKKLKPGEEAKVVQIAGYIAEQTAYHHGDASLHATIINMAQDFTGANNVPLLEPVGQFGTRAVGGQDAASPRYIFTRLSPMTRALFPQADDALLDYQEEDGLTVEPKYFIPVIPTLLINGSNGIGTGWSSNVPSYNLLEVVERVECLVRSCDSSLSIPRTLKSASKRALTPWYRGFTGEISLIKSEHKKTVKSKREVTAGNDGEEEGDASVSSFLNAGCVQRVNLHTVEITELPVGMWTDDYKLVLCALVEKGEIKSFAEHHTTEHVRFVITASRASLDDIEARGWLHVFKLTSNIKISNMHAFDASGKLKKFQHPEDVIKEHFDIRWNAYKLRKQAIERNLAADELLASNKSAFIADILSGAIDLIKSPSSSPRSIQLDSGSKKKTGSSGISTLRESDILQQLRARNFASSLDIDAIRRGTGDVVSVAVDASSGQSSKNPAELDLTSTFAPGAVIPAAKSSSNINQHQYSYLLDMPIYSLTEERRQTLDNAARNASTALTDIRSRSESDLWLADLEFLRKAYKTFMKRSNN